MATHRAGSGVKRSVNILHKQDPIFYSPDNTDTHNNVRMTIFDNIRLTLDGILQMTYADLAIYHLFSHMVTLDETAPVRYPNVGRLYHSVGQQPHITKWVKERPHDII